MRRSLYFLSLAFLYTAGCSERTVFEYVDESENRCCKISAPTGGAEASTISATIHTDRADLFDDDYPVLDVEFVSPARDAPDLIKLEADLKTESMLMPDSFEMSAGFFDAFTTDKFPHAVPPSECCQRMDLRIKNNTGTGDYGPVRFGVRVRKTYASLRRLPPEMVLVVSVQTARGRFQENRKILLSSFRSEGGVPFRFH